MEKQEFSFLSADGKTSIHAAVWIPAVPVRAIVEVSHGVSEHILRYESLAAYLTERGFAVIGHDHLGHGSSVIPGAPRLYLGPPGSWETATRDLDTCRRLARERFGRLPLFLLGHSMGSFLARTYLIRYPGTVDGAILVGTGQMSPAVLAVGSALARAECRRLGETQISPLVERLAFGPYNKPFSPARTPYDWLSLDPSNVDAYLADPLCGGDSHLRQRWRSACGAVRPGLLCTGTGEKYLWNRLFYLDECGRAGGAVGCGTGDVGGLVGGRPDNLRTGGQCVQCRQYNPVAAG